MSIEYFLHGFVGAGARGGEEPRLRLVLCDRYRVVIGLLWNSMNHTVVRSHNFVRSIRGAVAEIVLSLVRLRAIVVVGGDGHYVLVVHRGVTHALIVMHVGRFHRIGRAVLTH